MNKEEWFVILNMNCQYEICRKCPKSGLFKGTHEECEKWIEQKKKEERKEKSILEMVGGEKYINPHYNIKAEKMNKDEMKNKISMVLKDPILQQGFEIICKENAELKGEADSVLDNWCKGDDPCPHLKKRDEQLTKAKEIIRRYLTIGVGGKITQNYLDVTKEAEQFLKDCDIDNAIQQANKGLDFDKIADEMEQDLKDSEVEK